MKTHGPLSGTGTLNAATSIVAAIAYFIPFKRARKLGTKLWRLSSGIYPSLVRHLTRLRGRATDSAILTGLRLERKSFTKLSSLEGTYDPSVR